MGNGDEKLGQLLLNNYLNLLIQKDNRPKFIAFYNAGVKTICKDAPTVENLKILENLGVKLIACKTCINHFELLDKMVVGIAGTMIDIIELQTKADKVINL